MRCRISYSLVVSCHWFPCIEMTNLFSKHFSLNLLKCFTIHQSSPPHHISQDGHDDDIFSSCTPNLDSVRSSRRFFFSSPGRSNSIIHTRPRNSNSRNDNTERLLSLSNGSVRVPRYSLDPYLDFRRSMQEMIDSRQSVDVTEDWDYLHDLLLSYLSLNPSHTHKYVFRAFTDLVVHLLSSSTSPPSPSPPLNIKLFIR